MNISCTGRGGGTEVCQRQSDFPLGLHVVSEDAELVAVPTSLSRRVGLSAPEASSADEPVGAAATPLVRLGADGCSAAAFRPKLAGSEAAGARACGGSDTSPGAALAVPAAPLTAACSRPDLLFVAVRPSVHGMVADTKILRPNGGAVRAGTSAQAPTAAWHCHRRSPPPWPHLAPHCRRGRRGRSRPCRRDSPCPLRSFQRHRCAPVPPVGAG